MLTGCLGDTARDEREEKERPKPDFELRDAASLPSNAEQPAVHLKPGHWTTISVPVLANHYDARGRLVCEFHDWRGNLILPADDGPRLQSERSIILPKGQQRYFELRVLPPLVERLQMTVKFQSDAGPQLSQSQPVQLMPAHQHLLLVLAENPDDYRYLLALDSVQAPTGGQVSPQRGAHYQVELPEIGRRRNVPDTFMSWTSTAYLVWDGLQPELLTPQQQEAIIDWLHWGGQLIVSGPGSLDLLPGSFLSQYLPVHGAAHDTLDDEALAAIAAFSGRHAPPVGPIAAQQLELIGPQAGAVLSSGEEPLLVECPVGRGRIVVSAFPLASGTLISWPGYDELFNACLLRRDPRRFSPAPAEDLEADVHVKFDEGNSFDPQRTSRVRLFARDAGIGPSPQRRAAAVEKRAPPRVATARSTMPATPPPTIVPPTFNRSTGTQSGNSPQSPEEVFDMFDPPVESGVAGWSETGPVARAAREALRDAAGIIVPAASFVAWMVLGYLLVLVPLNAIVFKVVGRVEWSWIAAPVLAIAGAILVARLAELDIGFARARTDVGVLELQADYPRGHLTMYSALYNSLGTNYRVAFDDPGAAATPFGGSHAEGLLGPPVVSLEQYLREADGHTVALDGFEVASNSTAMVHSERFVPLDGALQTRLADDGRWQVTNGSQLTLRDAALVSADGAAFLGTLEPGQSAAAALAAESDEAALARTAAAAQLAGMPDDAALLRPLVQLAGLVEPGELRLVAWTDEPLEGLAMEPRVSQQRQVVLIVAHLHYTLPPPPQPDKNSRVDVTPKD